MIKNNVEIKIYDEGDCFEKNARKNANGIRYHRNFFSIFKAIRKRKTAISEKKVE
tara:strand:+ start:136 stop:300 length:165 start_codon:yes stop_codon:yes gene_type:complete